MTIQEYNRFGRSGRKDWFYVLCEDPAVDNSPRLNKRGLAFAVDSYEKCDVDGFYPCSCLHFSFPNDGWHDASTGGLGRSVRFNPATEDFRFGPPEQKKDMVRPIDFDF